MSIESVELAEIVSDKNRTCAKDEGFGQLKESIREHGIIEPPVVRRLSAPETGYRVVAGRRRIAALLEINKEDKGGYTVATECVVIAADDPRSDEEIALSENVNRLDMHPLDEAALFSGMAQRGMTIEKIAERYARSRSAIYKRLRLSSLADELKGMFRDERINISAAAVLAELPEEDQKDFFKQHEKEEKVNEFAACDFIRKKQKFVIRESMEKACGGCKKRTHNEGNELFEEVGQLSDVCLDADCYRLKWYEMISKELSKEHRESEITDGKIFFEDGIPELLYKKASKVRFKIGKAEAEFEVLREKGYEFTGESKKKTGCCWKIIEDYAGNIIVKRVGYKKKEPQVRSEKSSGGDVERYGKGVLKAVAAERGCEAGELAKELETKGAAYYQFENKVKDKIFKHVVSKRMEEEKTGAQKQRDYFSMFMLVADGELSISDHSFIENQFSVRQKEWQKVFLGGKSLKQIADDMNDETQKLFHFLLLSCGLEQSLPDIDEIERIKKYKSKNDFLDYSELSADEYKALYIEFAKEAAGEVLKPKKEKKAPLKKNKPAEERKCRVCGCTENDCRQCVEKTGSPCHWVEDDLCSACVAEAEDEETEEDPF